MARAPFCSYGRVRWQGGVEKHACTKRPEPGSMMCPEHRAEGRARIVLDERVRPWPGLIGGYKRRLEPMP